MSLTTHGDLKYQASERLGLSAAWPSLRVEHRRLNAGPQTGLTLECTEIALVIGGQAGIKRTGDGVMQDGVARPGTAWLCPVGVYESRVECSAPIECVHLYLPPALIEGSALADYDIDPAAARLAYVGGVADPMLMQIGAAFRGLLDRGMQATDRLLVDGLQRALAAHLLGAYALDRWRPPTVAPTLDAKRLKRVLDLIEARLASAISLDDLAAEACLSPFHFSRLFREATGLSPHRYVTDRRVQAACEKLAIGHSSLVEIALDCGFGSQPNFNRVFRKAMNLSPGRYRELHAR